MKIQAKKKAAEAAFSLNLRSYCAAASGLALRETNFYLIRADLPERSRK